jgi:hypothetical protein
LALLKLAHFFGLATTRCWIGFVPFFTICKKRLKPSMTDSANLPWFLHNRRLTEYNRDFGVCKVGNQSQQLPALTENRYQAEQQQLAEMRSRSVLQRLYAVFLAGLPDG